MCSLSQILHMRSVCAIQGEMSDENQLIFIFVRVTKLRKFMSKTFGAGSSSSLCSFSITFHVFLISFPCSYLVSYHQNELSREQLMDILMINCPVTLKLKQIHVSNMSKMLYVEVIQPQICYLLLETAWKIRKDL